MDGAIIAAHIASKNMISIFQLFWIFVYDRHHDRGLANLEQYPVENVSL